MISRNQDSVPQREEEWCRVSHQAQPTAHHRRWTGLAECSISLICALPCEVGTDPMGTTRAPSRVYNLARWLGELERLSILNSPLTEGRSVDDNNGVLDQGLGPHQLIVAGVVDNIDDPGLASSRLRGPCEVASVQPGHEIGSIPPNSCSMFKLNLALFSKDWHSFR